MLKPAPDGDASCLIKVKEALVDSLRVDGVSQHDARGGYGMLNASAWFEETQAISAC